MGVNSSSIGELSSNESLKTLAGSKIITEDDPFWNQLLSFKFLPPQTCSDARLLEEATSSICKQLVNNNLQTGNFCALVKVFLRRANELKTSTQCNDFLFTWQTYNALFIIRCVCKYMLENISEGRIKQQFSVVQQEGAARPDGKSNYVLEDFLNAVVKILIEVPVLDFTYMLHLEGVTLLLIMLSVQMFIPRVSHESIIFQLLMSSSCSKDAHVLIKTLLDHFIEQKLCPEAPFGSGQSGGSFLYGVTSAVATGLWTVMTLGYGAPAVQEESKPLLANQSLLLLLVLGNHDVHRGAQNPYRQALCTFSNSQDGGSANSLTGQLPPFKLNFSNLYEAFCHHFESDQTTLLFYLLLHRNTNFRQCVLSKTNIDNLVLPLLKILYNAPDSNSHHIYMALIVLLILSEDDAFNKSIHEVSVKTVTWYTERSISEMTLGGLIVLVVIRTIQYNMTRMRDKYLHTNCLAALANMSSQFHSLHPYVTQRIVSLFELLSRKHGKIIEQLSHGSSTVANSHMDEQDYMADLAVLEEVLRMVLEIINSCLTNTIHHNPNLVYTLLYKKHLFISFKSNSKFQDIIQNIDTVLSYFSARLDQHSEGKNLSVEEVLEIIRQGMMLWNKESLRKFPDLKFKYVEEEEPEEFFLPYVWSLVYHSSNLYWDADRIELFNLNSQ
ncbi:dymeclin-like [Anneissia japonica]|uniref:dymeclin-like n=1 Tax=Anneissia japonica TaxID=1529436 RepID=UPI00142598CA|nr:dymeclin-like [Anneissia japonica]XP_033127313.1 dymeclin-like [Anneissia japonica]